MMHTLLLVSTLLLVQIPPAGPARTGSIIGQLRYASGSPASGVRVVAMLADDGSGRIVGGTQSGTDGRFELKQLPPARYYILAGEAAFPTYYNGVTQPRSATAVRVSAGANLRVDFTVRRVGVTVSGRMVFDKAGTQLPWVKLTNVRGGAPRETEINGGNFEFPTVVPGTYRVEGPQELHVEPVTITVASDDIANIRLVPKGAKLYTLSGRVLVSSPDFRLNLSKIRVFAQASGKQSRSADARADGRFEILDMPSGSYRLSAHSSETTDIGLVETTVAVLDKDTTAEVSVIPQVPTTIRVTMDDGSALPAGSIRMDRMLGSINLIGSIARDGMTTTFLIPGLNYVFLQPPEGYFLKSMKSGSVDVLTNGIDIGATMRSVSIDAVISRTPPATSNKFSVRGRITGGHPRMKVRLIGLNALTAPMEETTNAVGVFVFRNVSPGPYRLDVPPAVNVIPKIIALGGDVVDLNGTVPEGIIVSGRLTVMAGQNGRPESQPMGVSLRLTNGAITKVYPLAEAPFIDGLPPGSYAVSVEGVPEGFAVKSVSAGIVDLLRNPLRISESSTADEIQVLLQPSGRPQ